MQLALQYSAYAIGLWLNLLVISALCAEPTGSTRLSSPMC